MWKSVRRAVFFGSTQTKGRRKVQKSRASSKEWAWSIPLIEIRLAYLPKYMVGTITPLSPPPGSDGPETRKTCTDKFHWCCQILGCNGQRMCKLYTAVAEGCVQQKLVERVQFQLLLKVRKSREQFMVSSILLKNEQKNPTNLTYGQFFLIFRLLLGRIEDTIICFWDFLTIIFGSKVIYRTFFGGWDQGEK